MRDLAACSPVPTAYRGDDLLNQPDLAVSSGPERTEMAGFDAACREGPSRPGNRERSVSVVPTGVGSQQAECGQGLEGGPVKAGSLLQLVIGQPQDIAATELSGQGQMRVDRPDRDPRA